MHQKMIALLKRDLPEVEESQVTTLAAVIVGEQIEGSLDALVDELIASNIPFGKILAALLRCEYQRVQALLAHSDADDMRQQVQQFSACLKRFYDLQKTVVKAADRCWQQAVDVERNAQVMAQCKSHWEKQGVVQIYNYFNEMPVTAKVKYINASRAHVVVECMPQLGTVFAATEDMREAMTRSPDGKYAIHLAVVDCKHGVLKLIVRSVGASGAESRRQVRVILEGRLPIVLKSHGQSYPAIMRDLSATGIGVIVNETVRLQPGQMVACTWKQGDQQIYLEAMLRWTFTADTHEHRAGLQFIALGPFDDFIRKFILSQQHMIISRLKKLPEPSWMQE